MTTPAFPYDDIPTEEKFETIFQDPSTEYVLVSSRDFNSDDEDTVERNPQNITNVRKIFRTLVQHFNPLLLNSLFTGFFSNAQKAMMDQIKLQPNLSAPTMGSTIYKSYDWVSDVVIDEQGSRLILPGQLVVLDSDHAVPTSEGTSNISSLFGSSTIMVSAHDLLAIQSQTQEEDYGDIIPLSSPTLESPQKNIAKRLWKLGTHKFQSAHQTVGHSRAVVVDSISREIIKLEQQLQILSIVSDLLIQTYEWCFPIAILAASDTGQQKSQQDKDRHQDQAEKEIITIELTTRS
jgi:hypothetical protein